MKEKFYGVAERRGTFGDKVSYPHSFLQGVMIGRKLSTKPVKLKENVAESDAAFGGLGKEGGFLLPATKIGFPRESGRCSSHSYFVELNTLNDVAKAVKIDPDAPYDPNVKVMKQYTCVIDYPRLTFAEGNVPPIKVTATLDKENNKILCTQEADTIGGTSRDANDIGWCVVYDPTNKLCVVEKLRERSESGSTSITMPAGTDFETLLVYAFTTRAKGKPTSNSECIIKGNTNLVAIARIADAMKVKLPLTSAADKLNAIVDSELARLDALRAADRERDKAERAEVKAKKAAANASTASDSLDDLLGDLLALDSTPEEPAPRFAERVEILAALILTLKKKHEEERKK